VEHLIERPFIGSPVFVLSASPKTTVTHSGPLQIGFREIRSTQIGLAEIRL